MELHVIGTGSAGNAYVLDYGGDQILLDCGLRWPAIQEALGFDLSRLRAVFVSHEHKDHCRGVQGAIDAGLDCVMSAGTRDAIGIRSHRARAIPSGEPISLGPFTVIQFATEHDAAEPTGWLIRHDRTGETLLYATDTYYLRIRPRGVHYYMVECNYMADTLERNIQAGRIDEAMRYRLLHSHFELRNAIDFLQAADLSVTRHIVLVHMSDANMDERRMVEAVRAATGLDTTPARNGIRLRMELCPF